jgi:hypothetical protein
MSVLVYSPTYTDQVDMVLAEEFPENAVVDWLNNEEYMVFSSYYSLVKYVGRHVSARVPRDYLQVPEGHRWLRNEVDRLRIGLQQQNRTLPPVFMNMVLHLIEDEKVELSEELYGGVFAREILGLDRFHRRDDHECNECMCRILHGAGYDCVMRGTV